MVKVKEREKTVHHDVDNDTIVTVVLAVHVNNKMVNKQPMEMQPPHQLSRRNKFL